MPHYIYTDRSRGSVIGSVQQNWKIQGMVDWLMEMHGKYIPPRSQPYDGPRFDVHAGVVVFECDASDIVAADKMMAAAMGIIASKRGDVCCAVL